MEEIKKWNVDNIDYFVNNSNIIILITHKWYKMRDNDQFNNSTFTYSFQTVHSAAFLLRGILVTMSRNVTVKEQEMINDFVRFLLQGQRNDINLDTVKSLQDGWNWKQKRDKNPNNQKNQKGGKNNNRQQRPQQRQQQQKPQQRQKQVKPNNNNQNKDDCNIM